MGGYYPPTPHPPGPPDQHPGPGFMTRMCASASTESVCACVYCHWRSPPARRPLRQQIRGVERKSHQDSKSRPGSGCSVLVHDLGRDSESGPARGSPGLTQLDSELEDSDPCTELVNVNELRLGFIYNLNILFTYSLAVRLAFAVLLVIQLLPVTVSGYQHHDPSRLRVGGLGVRVTQSRWSARRARRANLKLNLKPRASLAACPDSDSCQW
jgi:hypothetical protein